MAGRKWRERAERKRRTVLSWARRWELAAGDYGPRPSSSFLRALERQDRELELYWHPLRNRWVLYRRVRRGAVPLEDWLLKELEITGPRGEYRPLGAWLIDWLRANDKTSGGAVDPERGTRKYLLDLLLAEKRWEENIEAQRAELGYRFARDAERYCLRAPFSREVGSLACQTGRLPGSSWRFSSRRPAGG